jgi:hypothetical protein
LENVLAINPNNAVARRGLEQLIASKREAGKERSSNVLCYPLSNIRLTPNQFQLYERAQFLHREAKQNYVVAMNKLRNPVSPGCRKSWGPKGDSEWLEKLQEVASELYDRVVSLRSIEERVVANGQELETLVPKFIGVRARRIQEMTTEVQEWASELHVQLGETLRLADEWQLKADQWEMELMTEDPDEREVRWIKEEIAIEAASYDGQDLYEWGVWE